MTCSDFYARTQSMINPCGLNLNQNGCVNNVYFGTAHPVVFHDQWSTDSLESLKILQDLLDWENSPLYVEAHRFTASDGTDCVSLSATSDPQYDNDVFDVVLTADNIEIQGIAR